MTADIAAPAPRAHIGGVPLYRPGRPSATSLASNEQPWGPTEAVLDALASAARRGNRYPDNGALGLRSALADMLDVGVDRVTVGPGSVGLLRQLSTAYAGPGDEVAFAWPSFEAYPIDVQLSGASAVRVPLRRFTIDAGRLAGAVTDRTRLVLVASPNNPTGTAMRRRELLQLADALPVKCLLVVDEAYREFVTGADVPDALTLLGDRANVVVLRTFSKAFGLAGLRVGYLVAATDVVDAVDRVAIPFAVNALAQAAAAAALQHQDEMVRRVSAIQSERARLARELRALGYPVPDAQANFVWLPCGPAADDVAATLRGRGVATRAFADVGVRVTVGRPEENDAFLAAFAELPRLVDHSFAWELPTGETAWQVGDWLDRLDAVEQRLIACAHRLPSPGARTEADPVSGEQWDGGQVWAHLAEFGRYWLDELDTVVDGPDGAAVPFGRVKSDAGRVAAIEHGRHTPAAEHLASVRAAIDALRARLAELKQEDWLRVGRHSSLGDLDLAAQLQHFHIGHYEEHADQLEALAP